jgi:thiamine biosynthesis lipoprotein
VTFVRTVETMGTVVSITVRPGSLADDATTVAVASARAVLKKADALFSTWKADSPMSRLRRGEITQTEAPAEMAVVLGRCAVARDLTGGWFDPWAAPGGVDPTGLVKGWATRKALDVLVAAGVAGAVVNAGGDVALFGAKEGGAPWRMGIQNPFDRSTLAAVAEPEGSIATSGCYERGAHIFDPFTGRPASAVASASVTGPELDLADAMATALVAGGEAAFDAISAVPGYESLLIGHDGRFLSSPGFPMATVEV